MYSVATAYVYVSPSAKEVPLIASVNSSRLTCEEINFASCSFDIQNAL